MCGFGDTWGTRIGGLGRGGSDGGGILRGIERCKEEYGGEVSRVVEGLKEVEKVGHWMKMWLWLTLGLLAGTSFLVSCS